MKANWSIKVLLLGKYDLRIPSELGGAQSSSTPNWIRNLNGVVLGLEIATHRFGIFTLLETSLLRLYHRQKGWSSWNVFVMDLWSLGRWLKGFFSSRKGQEMEQDGSLPQGCCLFLAQASCGPFVSPVTILMNPLFWTVHTFVLKDWDESHCAVAVMKVRGVWRKICIQVLTPTWISLRDLSLSQPNIPLWVDVRINWRYGAETIYITPSAVGEIKIR